MVMADLLHLHKGDASQKHRAGRYDNGT
jgi:hypothetical protein